MRARGLKPASHRESFTQDVAPHAGAWIETVRIGAEIAGTTVAPHAGAWIETFCQVTNWIPAEGRAPCGRVD